MLGAITGDTVGSIYEFHNIKTKEFPFLSPRCNYTDDSVMTIAVAQWLLQDPTHSHEELERIMVQIADEYPCPMGGYGGGFHRWLEDSDGEYVDQSQPDGSIKHVYVSHRHPYNSWGNGSAMRVSACGWIADSLAETERIAALSASITHNHPEGIKGAQATAAAIFMARNGSSKQDIKAYVEKTYGYDLTRTCDQIRPTYRFNESCQGTVPEAIVSFLESTDFEDCIRLGVSLGGDTDTLCCIAGGIAEAFYGGVPDAIAQAIWQKLPDLFRGTLRAFTDRTPYALPSCLS